MPSRRLVVPVSLAAASAFLLAGCADASAGADGTDDGRIRVVASTNVYGQLVEEIGGDLVHVTSIVASGAQDPHSFEPSARDQLAISRADLIVENGGGYDAFIDALVEASGSEAPVVTAVEFSHDWPGNEGHDEGTDAAASAEPTGGTEDRAEERDHADHGHVEGFNEHVWYDPHTVAHLAEGIAAELSALAPDDAEMFAVGAATIASGVEEIEAQLEALDAAHAGTEIFATERVPLYLTAAAGLRDVAPDAFAEAVEEGQDVPPATLLEALELLQSGTVKVVVANAQTGGAETAVVLDEAAAVSIPVVEFTETVPEGQTYLSWMTSNVEALSQALAP